MPAKKEILDEYEGAALAIWEADFLLIVAGPSFYEDSSKAPFMDELCDAFTVQSNPDQFFGFWGLHYNRYMDRGPHDGYHILRKWRDLYFDPHGADLRKKQGGQRKDEEEAESNVLQRCFVITTTIDGSFSRSGFPDDEVYEVYGSINHWQCWLPCTPKVWSIDPSFRFEVDPILNEARPIKYIEDTRLPLTHETWDADNSNEGRSEVTLLQPKQQQVHQALLYKLQYATVVDVVPEYQDAVPDMQLFVDHFTPTPTSNYQNPITFTFPDLDGPHEEPASLPKCHETPYILQRRINHTLQHTFALHFSKYTFEEGVFWAVDRIIQQQTFRRQWEEKQKFFDPVLPELTHNRKQHIFYCISLFLYNSHSPPPPPLLFPNSTHSPNGAPVYSPLASSNADDPLDTALPHTDSWQQGNQSRWYFSYTPITSTFADSEGHIFDKVHIAFPYCEEEHIPRNGKVSVVVEACEYPEPVAPKEEPAVKKDKKKKDEVETFRRLDPIPEPVKYSAFQLIGCIDGTNRGYTATGSASQSDTRSVARSANQMPRVMSTLPSDDCDDFEHVLSSATGQTLRIGAAYTNPMAIKYIEVDCLVSTATVNQSVDHWPSVLPQPSDAVPAKKGLKNKPRPVANHQMCIVCRALARPNVMMDTKKDIRVLPTSRKTYAAWESVILKKLKNNMNDELVILEMGCEKKMDPARKLSERLHKVTKSSQHTTYIRIAPEDLALPKASFRDSERRITILDTVVNALNLIDRRMMEIKRRK